MKDILDYSKRYGIYVLGAILLLAAAIRFAAPVKDGDFFWHVKYGEYMLENRTLVPDHSIYSWTPADNNAIKCNWIADIFFYLMHRAGGLSLLFVFRYLCAFAVVGIVWTYAWRMAQGRNVFTFLVLAVVLLSSYSASFLKPEIISMVFMAMHAGLYFSVKASLWGRWGTKPFLFYPLLFLLWANTHEVFFFGLILLGLITFGEIVNYWRNRKGTPENRYLLHLSIGTILSLAVTFITPYGYRLHHAFYNLLTADQHLGFTTVSAYEPIFSRGFYHLHYIDFWVIMLISFVVLFSFCAWKKQERDWAILLATIFLMVFYARYARATYYWPAFWGMSIVYLRSRIGPYRQIMPKVRTILNSGIIVLFLFLSARSVYDSRYSPFLNQWPGFGIGYSNPVQESAFLKEHQPGTLLYNSYGVGGYLIYDLYPVYKVFCDPRYFPYKKWYAEYLEFNHGKIPLEEFLKKYPFDVALMDHHFSKTAITAFYLSRKWKPVFYGCAAIVFAKKDLSVAYDVRLLDKKRFDQLHTLHQAYTVFIVAQNLDDLDASEYILELIKKKFHFMPEYKKIVKVCTLSQDGLTAMAEGNYETAFAKLSILGLNPFRFKVNNSLLQLRNWKVKQLVQKGEYRRALDLIETTLLILPDHVVGLYNAGIIGYMIESRKHATMIDKSDKQSMAAAKTPYTNTTNWQNYLERFLRLVPNHPLSSIARQVLEGKSLPQKVPLASIKIKK